MNFSAQRKKGESETHFKFAAVFWPTLLNPKTLCRLSSHFVKVKNKIRFSFYFSHSGSTQCVKCQRSSTFLIGDSLLYLIMISCTANGILEVRKNPSSDFAPKKTSCVSHSQNSWETRINWCELLPNQNDLWHKCLVIVAYNVTTLAESFSPKSYKNKFLGSETRKIFLYNNNFRLFSRTLNDKQNLRQTTSPKEKWKQSLFTNIFQHDYK